MEIQEYFKSLQDEQVLTPEEAKQQLTILGDVPRDDNKHLLFENEGQKLAYDDFIRKNMRLVLSRTLRFCRISDPRIMDLVSAGTLGLIRAIEKFDVSAGFRFSTYGTYWIDAMLYREIRVLDPGTILYKSLTIKYKRMFKDLKVEFRRTPSQEEVFARLEWTQDQRIKYLSDQERIVVPIDSLTQNQVDLYDPAIIDEDPLGVFTEELSASEERHRLAAALRTLDESEHAVISHRYGLAGFGKKTYDELMQLFDMPREKIRHIENEACRKLWVILRGDHYHN